MPHANVSRTKEALEQILTAWRVPAARESFGLATSWLSWNAAREECARELAQLLTSLSSAD